MTDAFEQRLAQLEQVAAVLADANRVNLQGLQEIQQQIAQFRHDALASRMFEDLAAASKLYPKQRMVIFLGREYFADNIKYAFLSFLDFARANDIACYFLPEDNEQEKHLAAAGLPCLSAAVTNWTTEHMQIMMSARLVVMCNIFHPYNEQRRLFRALLAGARFIQLWHGILFKETGLGCLGAPGDFGENVARQLAASGPFDVFVAPGKELQPEWKRRFVFERFEPLGYPRNDVLFREPTARERINIDERAFQQAANAARAGKPVVLYAPTFRDKDRGAWLARAGLGQLIEHCRARGYELLINLHPFEQEFLPEIKTRHPDATFIAPLTDIYPLLRHANVLITDYSSLMFDYLLLDRPLVFYRPDHADYISRSRPIIERQDPKQCGATATAIGDLIAAVETAVAASRQPEADPYTAPRRALRQRLHDHIDGKSGERLNALIKEQIEQG